MSILKQKLIRRHINCTCHEAYKKRGLTDPNCFLCEYENDIELIMNEYLNSVMHRLYQQIAKDYHVNIDRIMLATDNGKQFQAYLTDELETELIYLRDYTL